MQQVRGGECLRAAGFLFAAVVRDFAAAARAGFRVVVVFRAAGLRAVVFLAAGLRAAALLTVVFFAAVFFLAAGFRAGFFAVTAILFPASCRP